MNADRLKLEREIVYACIERPGQFARYARALPPGFFEDPKSKSAMEAIHSLADQGVEPNWINVSNMAGHTIAFPESFQQGTADLGVASKRLSEFVIKAKRDRMLSDLRSDEDAFDIMAKVNGIANDFSSILALHESVPMSSLYTDYIATIEQNSEGRVMVIPTGFPSLDTWGYGGLRVGNVSFLGGGPGVGKTSFMLRVAMNAAALGFKTAFIEGEMPSNELLGRMNAMHTGVAVNDIEAGHRMDAVTDFGEYVLSLPFELHIDFGRNVQSLVAAIREAVHGGAKLIFIDYMQVFVAKGNKDNEFSQIKALSETLRKLTLINNVHIVAASSLNRLEAGAEKLTLNSFYGGSQLGHDCATAIILSAQERQGEDVRLVTCEVVKNRHGRKGEFKINYELKTQNMVESADVVVMNAEPAEPFYAEQGELYGE